MSKLFNNFLLKILLLSIFIVLILNIWDYLINATLVEKNNTTNTDNNSNFKSVNNSSIWKTWVAITTNLWIRYTQRKELPATIYKDIFSVNEIISNQDTVNKELVWTNMQYVNEYRNVLKTDIKQLIDSSYDKSKILNAFIDQLEFRYVEAANNIKNLNEQKTVFMTNINNSNTQIETLKTKIQTDFQNNNSPESLKNLNKYLDLKKEYYYSRTYIVYINHFLTEYNYLNNYNKLLLDTLINNKQAIIKDAFVVIPDSWTGLLKDFNLLYSEEEIKSEE